MSNRNKERFSYLHKRHAKKRSNNRDDPTKKEQSRESKEKTHSSFTRVFMCNAEFSRILTSVN